MSKSKRLHPIASIVTTAKQIKNLLFPLLAIIFSTAKGSLLISFIISLGLILITLVSSILAWFRYTYRFEANELRIEYGIFIRKKRYIPFERIQSIDETEGILQRLFGLVKVEIETAGGRGSDEADAVLSAISKKEAKAIQDFVAAAKKGNVQEVERETGRQAVFQISAQQLLLLSLTSGGVGVVLSAVVALLSQLDDFIPYQSLFGSLEKWAVHNLVVIAIMVFIGFVLAWFVALLMTLLKYAHFTVDKTETDLIISQGLLERRQLTIPVNRIQSIRVTENLIRQWLGYGTVHVESAGGSTANIDGAKVVLIPMAKVKEIRSLIERILPEYEITREFHSLPKRAKWRYIIRMWYIAIPIVVISFIFLKVWGLLSLILFAVFTIWAALNYKAAGWFLTEQQLSLRFQTMNRTTVFMKKSKIQSLKVRESYFQQRKELGTLEAFVKSGIGGAGGSVVDMELSDIEKVYAWYSRAQKNRNR